jgi:endonuclease YncB( thermonuclease family)
VSPPADEFAIAPEDIPAAVPGMTDDAGADESTSTATARPALEANPQNRSRAIDPEVVAPPSTGEEPLERAEPRPPLSELSLALPPKPKAPGEWKGKPLFQPVATAAGTIEAKGHTIAISGIDIVEPDETCTDPAGKSWSCGQAARTAFRAFLRGRAITCGAPQGTGPAATAACRIGKQDLGAWLVENGWARPAGAGPYADAGEAARKAQKGIFGAAPDLSGLPPPPPVAATPMDALKPSPSILDLSGTAATPPDEPSTQQVFPPAPAQ